MDDAVLLVDGRTGDRRIRACTSQLQLITVDLQPHITIRHTCDFEHVPILNNQVALVVVVGVAISVVEVARHGPEVEPEVQVGREVHDAGGDGVGGQRSLGLFGGGAVGRAVDVQLAGDVIEVELLWHGGPEARVVFELGRDFTFHEVVGIAGSEPGQLTSLQGEHGVGQAAVTGLGILVAQVRVDDVAKRRAELADEVGQLHGNWRIRGVRVAVAVGSAVRVVLLVAVVGVAASGQGEQGDEREENGGGEGRGHGVLLRVEFDEGSSCANRSLKMTFCQ